MNGGNDIGGSGGKKKPYRILKKKGTQVKKNFINHILIPSLARGFPLRRKEKQAEQHWVDVIRRIDVFCVYFDRLMLFKILGKCVASHTIDGESFRWSGNF